MWYNRFFNLACLTCLSTGLSQQLAFFNSKKEPLPDASTKSSSLEIESGKVEGLFVETRQLEDGRHTTILFLVSDEPFYGTTFFDYYDSTEKALVLDLYDFKIGNSLIEQVKEPPISGNTIEEFQVDLNKDVAGFLPDIRDVVRLKFFTEYQMPYTIDVDNFNQLRLEFTWSDTIRERIAGSYARIAWKTLLSVLSVSVLSYGGYVTYQYMDF